MTPEQLADQLAAASRNLATLRQLIKGWSLTEKLRLPQDRVALNRIITDLGWASENLEVVGLHQRGEKLDDLMGFVPNLRIRELFTPQQRKKLQSMGFEYDADERGDEYAWHRTTHNPDGILMQLVAKDGLIEFQWSDGFGHYKEFSFGDGDEAIQFAAEVMEEQGLTQPAAKET